MFSGMVFLATIKSDWLQLFLARGTPVTGHPGLGVTRMDKEGRESMSLVKHTNPDLVFSILGAKVAACILHPTLCQ